MTHLPTLQPRQIWADPAPSEVPRCSAYSLPSSGYLVLNATTTILLDQDVVYHPACSAVQTNFTNDTLPVLALGDPFEASTIPQIFVLGCMLVIAWSLLIILLITPRSSIVVSSSGGGILGLTRLGTHNSGSATIIGIGGRPWLQKFASATVGISLFIAAINSFKIIQAQYNEGFEDADSMTAQVIGSLEIRIMRVISTTSLWLAQVQTLIRLFQRHREKIIIKWTGFGLIVLDTLFTILNNFVSGGGTGPTTVRPRRFTEAIPALAYLFELALGLLYAAWVFYYALTKRRFAFFHPKMRNICLVALLSIVSVSIPVVFFVVDIAKPDLSGWGDYIRWVGAAAASVVVWEWVERIEALEREEMKEGILGREIFDGDEMLHTKPSVEVQWPWSRSIYKGSSFGSGGTSGDGLRNAYRISSRNSNAKHERSLTKRFGLPLSRNSTGQSTSLAKPSDVAGTHQPQQQQDSAARPIASPISRSETDSANSTVYAVIHNPASSPVNQTVRFAATTGFGPQTTSTKSAPALYKAQQVPADISQTLAAKIQSVPNPFKRRRQSPPPEVSSAVDAAGAPVQWAKSRSPKNLFRLRRQPGLLSSELPVVVVPAQPRGQIWSPPPEEGEGGALKENSSAKAIAVTPTTVSTQLGTTLEEPNSQQDPYQFNYADQKSTPPTSMDPVQATNFTTSATDLSTHGASLGGLTSSEQASRSRTSPLQKIDEDVSAIGADPSANFPRGRPDPAEKTDW